MTLILGVNWEFNFTYILKHDCTGKQSKNILSLEEKSQKVDKTFNKLLIPIPIPINCSQDNNSTKITVSFKSRCAWICILFICCEDYDCLVTNKNRDDSLKLSCDSSAMVEKYLSCGLFDETSL